MPTTKEKPIFKKVKAFERRILRQIDRVKAIAYEEFEIVAPEVDNIIAEGNTDFDFITYIFTTLMSILLVVEKDEKVVSKAEELLRYAISMDMKASIVLVLEYNYVMNGSIGEIPMDDFVDKDFLKFLAE